MGDSLKIIEWIRTLPDKERGEMKKILLELNELRVNDPKGFKYIVKSFQQLIKNT